MSPDLLAAGLLLGPGLLIGPVCLIGHRRARQQDDTAAAVLAAFRPVPPAPAPPPGEPRPLPQQQLATVTHLDTRRPNRRNAA
ncbi:hypothetical protein GO001_12040 [Streptomyces sp. NRRL B-1677]|uniref:hypothetical protein n=1 Tax=Streptomyces sp. NRRL B-1677 TaxID=2682966 RepID=UPI001892BB20|nr:hypothetical protein [Streptomyces sp. NRRL B-1677]MBF6045950.1 hypothetical protein [Streptomyces sp. NRRL B-1677]